MSNYNSETKQLHSETAGTTKLWDMNTDTWFTKFRRDCDFIHAVVSALPENGSISVICGTGDSALTWKKIESIGSHLIEFPSPGIAGKTLGDVNVVSVGEGIDFDIEIGTHLVRTLSSEPA